MALYGRHGEAPLPVVAAYSPSHCFEAAIEAARIALKYRTPVILLSDGYIANGAEPWSLPDVDALPDISVPFATELNHSDDDGTKEFWPYLRDPDTLARPWAIPGTPGLMHRVGGIEKEDGSGNISYDAGEPRAHGAAASRQGGRHRQGHPARRRARATRTPSLLVLGWGSTWGAIDAAGRAADPSRAPRWRGSTSSTSTRCRPTWARSCAATRRVVVPEMNLGQLCRVVRAEYLVDAQPISKVQGAPFTALELEQAFGEVLATATNGSVA